MHAVFFKTIFGLQYRIDCIIYFSLNEIIYTVNAIN